MITQCTVEVTCDECGEEAIAVFEHLPALRDLERFLERDNWDGRRGKNGTEWICGDCLEDEIDAECGDEDDD